MAKKKNRRGVRTYKPHSFGTFIYALFGLAVVGALVGFFFLPMFTFGEKSGGEVINQITFTGLGFFKLGIRKYLPQLSTEIDNANANAFLAYFNSVTPENELLKIIAQFHEIIELVIVGFIVLAALWGVIEFLLAFFFFILGKSSHPKGVCTFAWLTFWFFAISFGLAFMYLFFYGQIIQAAEVTPAFIFPLPILIILGGMFVACIILAIIHRAYLKDRVPLEKNRRRGRHDEEPSNMYDDNTQGEVDNEAQEEPVRPQVQLEMQKPQPQESPKVNDVITVGDRAYAKNTQLASAVIPEGIVALGSSAFSNCVNLTSVSLPNSLQEIGFNCFFNTPKLTKIVFNGTIARWKLVKRGSNWLTKSGTKTVQCTDGKINVNPNH